ncbi:MAG: endolytic transglycosylase MltG, partial [Chitinophagaceae bacterium]
ETAKELFAGKMGSGKKFDVECDSLQMIQFLNNNDSLKKYGVDTNTVMALVMPYTFNLKWNSSPDNIFQQFYTAYKKFWTTERKIKADSLHLTPLQVITLASIVEEETNKKVDKSNIASTYLNRIKTGMKLQADPTVKFAMKNFALKRILGVHLQTVSPYNTYMYAGLPPGPICTPSVETIDAVLDAPRTDYLYFVASHKFDGSSIFTSDFNDHIKYARLYQQELTRRMDSSKKANANK